MGTLLQLFIGHKEIITSVAISHNGSLTVTGSLDKTVKIWMAVTGEMIFSLIAGYEQGTGVTSVAISPDSN